MRGPQTLLNSRQKAHTNSSHTTIIFITLKQLIMFSPVFVLMALAPVQLAAFSLPAAIPSYRSPSTGASISSLTLDLTSIDLDGTSLIDNDMIVDKSRRRHPFSDCGLDDTYERWELRLINDAVNTRSYICRCLVEVAELSEEESFLRMKCAHEHGEAVVAEYCCEEYAEHYKEALKSRGVNCRIILVEE